MPGPFDTETLAELVLAQLDASPRSLRFAPVRTGKHNASFWVDSNRGRFVLRIAPPDDAGFLFYERLMMRQEPELHASSAPTRASRWPRSSATTSAGHASTGITC